jgi:tRNA 2-selenouridine synthase
MKQTTIAIQDAIASIDHFSSLLDARTPAEFALDHLPLAMNAPVLSDAQRIIVGTAHKQQGAFEAKRIGAAMVSRNIGDLIEARFANMPRDWAPLVYCWRGGNRSGSLTTVLRAVGWRAVQLEGGYKAFREHVVQSLDALVPHTFKVLAGPTGSGKSLLLQALQRQGAQVLDLEDLANHRGSVLGELPDKPQPTQKRFETLVWQSLRLLDPAKPIFVESESKRIGLLQVPEVLLAQIRQAPCVEVQLPFADRVALLKSEYLHFIESPEVLLTTLERLRSLYPRETFNQWRDWSLAGEWDTLVESLLVTHYDPLYKRSFEQNYANASKREAIGVVRFSVEAFDDAAKRLVG